MNKTLEINLFTVEVIHLLLYIYEEQQTYQYFIEFIVVSSFNAYFHRHFHIYYHHTKVPLNFKRNALKEMTKGQKTLNYSKQLDMAQ